MKTIQSVVLAIVCLTLLFGCSKNDHSEAVLFGPRVIIQYVDKSGNNLMKGVDKNSVEILSITDQAGNSFQIGNVGVGHNNEEAVGIGVGIGETFTLGRSPKAERIYTIRYKIPALLGEDQVETLKLVYLVDGWGIYTEAWYNQEKIENCYYPDRYNPEVGPPTPAEIEERVKAMEEKLYNGMTNAYFGGDSAFLILAIDKP